MFKPQMEMKPVEGGEANKESFGYEVARDDSRRASMIREAQVRFAAVNPDDVEAYSIIVVHKPGLNGADTEEVNTVVEFAGNVKSKQKMLTGYLEALAQDQRARSNLPDEDEGDENV